MKVFVFRRQDHIAGPAAIRLGVAGACALSLFYTFASNVRSIHCVNVDRDVAPRTANRLVQSRDRTWELEEIVPRSLPIWTYIAYSAYSLYPFPLYPFLFDSDSELESHSRTSAQRDSRIYRIFRDHYYRNSRVYFHYASHSQELNCIKPANDCTVITTHCRHYITAAKLPLIW